jgi:hypothetical protein
MSIYRETGHTWCSWNRLRTRIRISIDVLIPNTVIPDILDAGVNLPALPNTVISDILDVEEIPLIPPNQDKHPIRNHGIP